MRMQNVKCPWSHWTHPDMFCVHLGWFPFLFGITIEICNRTWTNVDEHVDGGIVSHRSWPFRLCCSLAPKGVVLFFFPESSSTASDIGAVGKWRVEENPILKVNCQQFSGWKEPRTKGFAWLPRRAPPYPESCIQFRLSDTRDLCGLLMWVGRTQHSKYHGWCFSRKEIISIFTLLLCFLIFVAKLLAYVEKPTTLEGGKFTLFLDGNHSGKVA